MAELIMAALRAIARFISNRDIERRWAILWGYTRLRMRAAWSRLGARSGPGSIRLAGFTVHYGDPGLLAGLYREVFINRIYDFETAVEQPLIIDAGANIGLATLFFKYRYPNARVHCFEPNPASVDLLRRNIAENGLKDVEIHATALAARTGSIRLYVLPEVAGGDIGASTIHDYRLAYHMRESIGEVEVPAERLSPYLAQPADMVK